MMDIRASVAGLVLAAAACAPGQAAEVKSAYTDLDLAQCTTVESDDTGAMFACPGYRGMPVMVTEGDLRMFVSFGLASLTEKAAEQTLPPFNHLGPKIEWRLEQRGDQWVPFATILRWYTADPETGADSGQVLVVTRVAMGATCHVAYVDAGAVKDANARARDIADTRARAFDCAGEPEAVPPFAAF